MADTIRVAVTGAAGQVAYAMLGRLASGEVFGPNQKVILQLLEIPQATAGASKASRWSWTIAASRRCRTSSSPTMPNKAFKDCNWALLVGSFPRKQGMERKDLLGINGKIFVGQGKALAANAATDVRILVVGNPCNTNCLVAYNNGRDIPAERWTAMTRLDHNRARTALAKKAGVANEDVTQRDHLGQPHQHAVPRLHQRQDQGQAGDRGHHRPHLAGEHVRAAVPEPRRRGHQGARLQLGACRPPTARSITSRAC